MNPLLQNVTVVSFTHYLQGPSCAQLLADLGARVIKVERVGGAYERSWSGLNSYLNDESVFYLLSGRNQESVEIDLKAKKGQEVAKKLIQNADVVIENYRPGVMDRLELGYEQVKEDNPKIIYCSLSGYGTNGPYKGKAGQDLLIQSLSGMTALNGPGTQAPQPVGTALVDQHAAVLGAMGILAALVRKIQTGEGCHVDSNLLSASLDLQIEPFNYFLNGFDLFPRSTQGISTRFHQAPYGVFATSDGYITVSLTKPSVLASVFSDPYLRSLEADELFEKRELVNAHISEAIRKNTTLYWEKVFEDANVWYAPVAEYPDVEKNPQVQANHSILEFEHPVAGQVKVLNHPVRYDGAPPALRRVPPALGEDTRSILSELGYSDAEIDCLETNGDVGENPKLT